VRAWSAALDDNDNAAAAKLFAPDAQVIQDGQRALQGDADAKQWNAALPCGGRIIFIKQSTPTDVVAVFELTERPHHICDAPGGQATALFRIFKGKIVVWHQLNADEPDTPVAARALPTGYFGSGSSL
jgi:hypothetical protein